MRPPAAASAVGDRFMRAPAAASAMGDRFMKHPDLLNLTATVDQHDLQQQPQPWGTG
ncbi:hypothetical protein DPMN_151564 [Dreissena polymorpha]|uniref:Uncharacterized protein n=1 Tax=Dreissena polymorpha TaxID=45954 RepID=A0A9D4J6L7_DREPO|nr:hypothetical protein DPMN_151564 [Dreissena polymorpha]